MDHETREGFAYKFMYFVMLQQKDKPVNFIKVDIFAAVTLKCAVFWDVKPRESCWNRWILPR